MSDWQRSRVSKSPVDKKQHLSREGLDNCFAAQAAAQVKSY